jgi:hypothetical protein
VYRVIGTRTLLLNGRDTVAVVQLQLLNVAPNTEEFDVVINRETSPVNPFKLVKVRLSLVFTREGIVTGLGVAVKPTIADGVGMNLKNEPHSLGSKAPNVPILIVLAVWLFAQFPAGKASQLILGLWLS